MQSELVDAADVQCMRHPIFLLVGVLNRVQTCASMTETHKLDLRGKICDLVRQCITSSVCAFDFGTDSGDSKCMYTQVQDLAASFSTECDVQAEIQEDLLVVSSMLLTSSLTGCLLLPLPCDVHSREHLQQTLRVEIEDLMSR